MGIRNLFRKKQVGASREYRGTAKVEGIKNSYCGRKLVFTLRLSDNLPYDLTLQKSDPLVKEIGLGKRIMVSSLFEVLED